MIIECPACATRYEVPDTAVSAGGRKVRCAKCRHSWVVTGGVAGSRADEVSAEVEGAAAGVVPEPADATANSREMAVRTGMDHDPELAEEPAPMVADPSSEAAPRVRRRGLWVWAAVIFAVLMGAAILAVALWDVPEWVPGRSEELAVAGHPELVLDFPRDQQGPRQLPNGTEIFGASGTITNAGATAQRVPPILIVLRDSRERIVYSWEVDPPKRRLAPGESVVINEAVTDAPRSAHFADIGWKPG